MSEEEKEENDETLVPMPDGTNVIIPKCCTNGWESCKHTVQKQRPNKRNIAV